MSAVKTYNHPTEEEVKVEFGSYGDWGGKGRNVSSFSESVGHTGSQIVDFTSKIKPKTFYPFCFNGGLSSFTNID